MIKNEFLEERSRQRLIELRLSWIERRANLFQGERFRDYPMSEKVLFVFYWGLALGFMIWMVWEGCFR